MRRRLSGYVLGGGAWLFSVAGCASAPPEPRLAVAALTEHAERGEAAAVHAGLTKQGRRELQPADVERIIADVGPPLAERLQRFRGADVVVQRRATVVLRSGHTLELQWEDGGFRLASTGLSATGQLTPSAALAAFRDALAARDFKALVDVLSAESAAGLEQTLDGLALDLAAPEALVVVFEGRLATVTTANGHRVVLEQEDGTWKIRDFE